jgi:iron complex transport system permease protein
MSARGIVLLGMGCLAAVAASVLIGPTQVAPSDVWQALRDPNAPSALVVRGLRAPRALLGFLIGGSLAVTGVALQALVRNPLAEPYLLGLSGGAGLGAVLAIASGSAAPLAVPIAAFAGALAAVLVVYRIATVAGRPLDPNILLLAGVVVSAFTGAIMASVMVLSDAAELRSAINWMLGSLGTASWRGLSAFSLYAVVPLAILWLHARALDLLTLGDEPASHLGVDVGRTRRVVYVSASLLTAASVAVCGIVGFVGLVIPHAIRRLGVPLHRALIPVAFLAGGAFLVACDTVARTVAAPIDLPVGAVTALIGVPLFAVLLRRSL